MGTVKKGGKKIKINNLKIGCRSYMYYSLAKLPTIRSYLIKEANKIKLDI